MLPALPPAQVQTAPPPAPAAEREIAFPGAGGLVLKGSVLAAPAGAWCALLVPDSGPLDRDWADPRLPGSHAGRALAQWLRDQGVASLRFDKRMHGTRDPRLDCSLDAQLGDLRAALATARSLPEARGRRLLLVGHGEGALLSLLVSREADALLLLAMPPTSMARSIAAQVRDQLPPQYAGPSLGYLEAVFQAIREHRPVPPAPAEVLPPVARLGRSLMAPETLDFVRATLDLDPWALAARALPPVAAAWGDRDVQARKPDPLPQDFRGLALVIPEANHLFRRETRPRGDLDGASALAGYGDEVPLADLSPLATWLRNLPGK